MLGWAKYIPVVICIAQVIQQVLEDIDRAKDDDGKVSVDEVLEIVKNGIINVIECVIPVVKDIEKKIKK